MERRPDAAARLPVRLWSDPRCSSPDGRGQLLSSPRSLFAVSFRDQIPAFSNLSLGKWGATSEKRRLCLLLMYNSRKGEKENKNGFYQLELTYFSRHLCFHILCLSIENIRRCPPPSPSPPHHLPNDDILGALQECQGWWQYLVLFKLPSVCVLKLSCFYLIGQLCSSSWVVWDWLIFISCL